MRLLVSLMLLVTGVIHLLPLSGVLGGARLDALYGMAFDDANLQILMRHRAVLFGLLGALLVTAAFRRSLQPVALIGGLVSVVGFLWLAWDVGGYNASIARVVIADLVALGCLLVAAAALAWQRRG